MTKDDLLLVSPSLETHETRDSSDAAIAGTFVFLPQGQDRDMRRQVRSRAAQYSHQIGPRKPKSSKIRHSGTTKPRSGRAKFQTYKRKHTTRGPASSSNLASQKENLVDVSNTPPSPIDTHIGGHADDPFQMYPVQPQPWFAQVLSEMWTFMLRGWTALPVKPAERDHALLWVQRLTMSNPSYFYMNMLSVAEDLVLKGRLDSRLPLWLISQVVATINEALGDTSKALAVGNILAVGRIAVHEIVLGDLQTGQNVHRPAWARMIKLAGGLDSLGLPALVRAHLGWADRLMVHKTGVRIADLEPTLAHEPTFAHAPQDFQTDIRVLRGYMPKRQPGSDGL